VTYIVNALRLRAIRLLKLFSIIASIITVAPASGACSLDVDGDGEVLATTDHVILTRYAIGIRGAPLIANALGGAATRTTATAVETFIATPCRQPGWVGDGTGRLNDTGVGFSGNYPSGNNTGCTGATVSEQDCAIGRDANGATNSNANGALGFHFTKISNSGEKLPASAALGSGANDWACTYDHTTGLTWEVKTTSGRRNITHTYTWFSSNTSNNAGSTGTANGGTCFDVGQCDTEKFAQLVNVAGLCGKNDWRVPNIIELAGINHYGISGPSIDLSFFPNSSFTDTNSFPPMLFARFWASTPAPSQIANAMSVDFTQGYVTVYPRNSGLPVRLVRGQP
jgi:hypothetical protein